MFEDAAPQQELRQEQLFAKRDKAVQLLQKHIDATKKSMNYFSTLIENLKSTGIADRVPSEYMDSLYSIQNFLLGIVSEEDSSNFLTDAGNSARNFKLRNPPDELINKIEDLIIAANSQASSLKIHLTELEQLAKQLKELDPLTQDFFENIIKIIKKNIQGEDFYNKTATLINFLYDALKEKYREDAPRAEDAAGKDDEDIDDEDHENALPPTEDALDICGECDSLQEA